MNKIAQEGRDPAPTPRKAPQITWPVAVTVMVALVSGFAFEIALIVVAGLPHWSATLITAGLVLVVVSVLLPNHARGGTRRRVAAALEAFLDGGQR